MNSWFGQYLSIISRRTVLVEGPIGTSLRYMQSISQTRCCCCRDVLNVMVFGHNKLWCNFSANSFYVIS